MSDRFGIPTREALREVDELCPGSDPTSPVEPAPQPPFAWKSAAIVLALGAVSLAGGWGLGVLCSIPAPPVHREAPAFLALPLTYPTAGTYLQSSGGTMAWVRLEPRKEAWLRFFSWKECFDLGGSIGASTSGPDCNTYCYDRDGDRIGRAGSPLDPPGKCATVTYGSAEKDRTHR